MNKNKLLIVSAGGCGNALLNTISNKTKLLQDVNQQAAYINFAKSDITENYKGIKFIIDAGGTGRDPKVGKEIAKENIDEIEEFLNSLLKVNNKKKEPADIDEVLVLASLGGGTGSSLIQTILEVYCNKKPTSLIAIMPSDKEGVATLPNAIKTYQTIYNDYVLPGRLKSFFIFDNEKFEKDFEISTYNWHGINDKMSEFIDNIYDDSELIESSGGYSSLDINERKRVIFWGKGISNYIRKDFNFNDNIDDIEFSSSVYSGKFKNSTAKAVSILALFKNKTVSEKDIQKVNDVIAKLKSQFKNAFFVFGFNFNNPQLSSDVQFRVVANGLDSPNMMLSDAKRVSKSVGKLKQSNHVYDTADLDLEVG